ncbi:MAG TPA: phage baseplate assembly protein V [Blastocatellia bacterium]|nr:phage baseplate assembly protein V [Blastocatellia bacterium]
MPDKYFGKYSGIVTDNLDALILGQLKVQVPAIFGPDEQVVARPALPYGVFFVPEIATKVWVEFEGGDPGLPIWTGVQSVPGEWAAEAQANPPKKRVIKTAAGHLIILDDTNGQEGIEIKSNTHIVIRCLGTIEIEGLNIIINGRAVVPGPRPI